MEERYRAQVTLLPNGKASVTMNAEEVANRGSAATTLATLQEVYKQLETIFADHKRDAGNRSS